MEYKIAVVGAGGVGLFFLFFFVLETFFFATTTMLPLSNPFLSSQREKYSGCPFYSRQFRGKGLFCLS
jgi:hypothetical protein